MDELVKLRVEDAFKKRMITQRIKYKSNIFYKSQVEFFSGAMATLNEVSLHWYFSIISDREIIDAYKI